MSVISGKLTKRLVANLGPGRHGDGNGLYLVVDPSGARRWVVRVIVKGQKNRQGKPLRTDFGLGGANLVTIHEARARALEDRRMARQGLNPRYNATREIPTFVEFANQVHIDRLPTWKNPKHGQQWINTLRDYTPHSFRRTLATHGDETCTSMREMKAWSMNLGREHLAQPSIPTYLSAGSSKGR